MRKKRVDTQSIESEGSETEAFKELVIDSETPDKTPETPDIPPESVHDPTVDEYLRKRIYLETYGTETPTDYERTLQALRNRL